MSINDYLTHCPFIDVGTKTRIEGVEFAAHTYGILRRDCETGRVFISLKFSVYTPNCMGDRGELYARGNIYYAYEPGKGITAEPVLSGTWSDGGFVCYAEGVEGVVTDYAHITPERFRELTRRMCVGVANKSVPVVRERLARLALDGVDLLED